MKRFWDKVRDLIKQYTTSSALDKPKLAKPYQIGPGQRNHHKGVKRTDGIVHHSQMEIYRTTLEKSAFREIKTRVQNYWDRPSVTVVVKSWWRQDGRWSYFQHLKGARKGRWDQVMGRSQA